MSMIRNGSNFLAKFFHGHRSSGCVTYVDYIIVFEWNIKYFDIFLENILVLVGCLTSAN